MARTKQTSRMPTAKRGNAATRGKFVPPTGKQPRVGGVKKVRRFKPGTVALREVQRVEIVESKRDKKDVNYIPSKAVSMIYVGSKPKTRGDDRVFFNAANALPVLPPDHLLDSEASQYRQFIRGLEVNLLQKRLDNGKPYLESDNAVWLSTIVRYKNVTARNDTIKVNSDKDFWSLNNGSCSSAKQDVFGVMTKTTKPICLIVGGAEFGQSYGHSVVLVIVNTSQGRLAYVKDTYPIQVARMKSMVRTVLSKLGTQKVTLVGMLDEEEEVIHTDCLREAYKTVGDLLDGKFFWQRRLDGVSIEFGIGGNKKIKV